jgi:hypothetical protein
MAPVDFEVWLNHFEYHAQHSRRVPHGMSGRLTPDERRLISGSIATFQLGEQSDGGTLLQATKQFGIARRIPSDRLRGMADTPLDAAPDGIYHIELPERLSLSVRFLP